MTTTTQDADSRSTGPGAGSPSIDTEREVRLALVMYGGVSLAIYMNGVAQELWHLVRSTAPTSLRDGPGHGETRELLVPDSKLESTEHVYRKLGRTLAAIADHPEDTKIVDVGGEVPITTRFVIDILSGTSAGGINAVFLAKALANDQAIEQLQELWMKQGDIGVLVNDAKSREKGLTLEHPPESLLNSGRMYFELLKAFRAMERTKPNRNGASSSPFVRELDLWVTSTDLRGVTLPVKIANGIAYERRYRSVWHFVYGTDEASGGDRNDFGGENDPMLAFASRATSAFPFAFKPMLFGDMAEPLKASRGYPDVDVSNTQKRPWLSFYDSYFPPPSGDEDLPDPEQQIPFVERPFADGGALDNKPFTWATDTLLRRSADVPVDRKLIFIEPDPGHPELEATKQGRPNLLENFLLQGNTLPRQETIRQDIQAVVDRNRTIVRVDRVLQGLAETMLADVPAQSPDTQETTRQSGDDWAAGWLEPPKREMPEPGSPPEASATAPGLPPAHPAYNGYVRLKVAAVTDDLRDLVASAAGFDQDSDELLAVGYLVREWRDGHYAYAPNGDRRSFYEFLLRFDLHHRLRRLRFLRRRVNALYPLNAGARTVIETATKKRMKDLTREDADFREHFRADLRAMKASLSEIQVRLITLGRTIRSKESPVAGELSELGIDRAALREVLAPGSDAGRREVAVRLVGEGGGLLRFPELLADRMAGEQPSDTPPIRYGTLRASSDLRTALDGDGPARLVLRAYAARYEDFDMVEFPMLYGTDAGETDAVEIVRISPEDATSIVDERGSGFKIRKTHGWKFNHFGAFLSDEWRKNDILFGRLDAAECLIHALVPACNRDRDALLQQAQAAILLEDLSTHERVIILGAQAAGLDDHELVERFAGEIVAWFKTDFDANYEARQTLPPGKALPVLARGVDVTGKMLDGIADQPGAMKKVTGWMARAGSTIARIVALGVPQSGYGMVFRHLFPLLLVFEALMVGLGVVFTSNEVIRVGVAALIVTLLLRGLMGLVRGFVEAKNWQLRVAKSLFALVILAVAAVIAAALLSGFGNGWSHPSRYWDGIVALWDHVKDLLGGQEPTAG